MNFDRTGIILYTIKYKACVDFYRNVLGLELMFTTKHLSCFAFGASYLMVELDDEYNGRETINPRTKMCLRMNVPDVKREVNKLIAKGIDVDYQEHSWGVVAKFHDPDGNLCAFKDSKMFEEQVKLA